MLTGMVPGLAPYSFPPHSPLKSSSYDSDEPRRRAPRALTGRYVKTGTAASPHVLKVLRKKVEDRMRLKEMLGHREHPYLGHSSKGNNNFIQRL